MTSLLRVVTDVARRTLGSRIDLASHNGRRFLARFCSFDRRRSGAPRSVSSKSCMQQRRPENTEKPFTMTPCMVVVHEVHGFVIALHAESATASASARLSVLCGIRLVFF